MRLPLGKSAARTHCAVCNLTAALTTAGCTHHSSTLSKNMRPWPTKDTEGKGGQCGGAWDYGMMSFKTGIGGLNGKKRISFKVGLERAGERACVQAAASAC